jgi:hypothetical protein
LVPASQRCVHIKFAQRPPRCACAAAAAAFVPLSGVVCRRGGAYFKVAKLAAFGVWTQFTVSTGKRVKLQRGTPLVARMFASNEHAWDPMASSSVNLCRKTGTVQICNGDLSGDANAFKILAVLASITRLPSVMVVSSSPRAAVPAIANAEGVACPRCNHSSSLPPMCRGGGRQLQVSGWVEGGGQLMYRGTNPIPNFQTSQHPPTW